MTCKRFFLLALPVWLGAAPLPAQRPDIVIADFEGTNYGNWRVSGEAFGPGPAGGTLPNQMHVDGFQGKRLVNSFYRGDGTIGRLTSPPFTLERRYLKFLVGGGGHPEQTCMNLLVDGKKARTVTGPNTQPGGSERLDWQTWDVGELAGRSAVLEIVDAATGGWGHINVDQIVQSDRPAPRLLTQVKRELVAARRYLNLPVKNGAPQRQVQLLVEGRVERFFSMELADAEPDWWAFVDLTPWRGRSLVVEVDKLPEDSRALRALDVADTIKGGENLYREPLRPQFHFTSRRGWNNDPNGLVYYRGEYHLFYQHNPFGWNWGNMHWGHAVSRDLVRWEELGDVLAPDPLGPMFSGSTVVDWKNSSGLGTEGQPPLVLFYTAAGRPTVQCLASSTDGRAFTKFSANPVVREITDGNRDPKVIWHEPSRKWVMVLYVGVKNTHTIHFLTSLNLKDWTVTSQIDGFFECPDLFELPVEGGTGGKKWVLTAASSEYMVGEFDGARFTPHTPKLPGHRGRGFYAAQTFSDLPAQDGRCLQIGWLQAPSPGMSFNQAMTMPLELRLLATPEGPRLTWSPAREMSSLRARTRQIAPRTLKEGDSNPLAEVKAELIEVRAELEPGEAEVEFSVRGAKITYEPGKQELVVNGHRAPAPLRSGKLSLAIYCDRTALEVFTSDGLCYVPMPFIPKLDDLSLELRAKGGATRLAALTVHELKSAWAAK
jgi:fructan beta-fructosidase